jgi:hypothetical protein
MPDWQAGDGRGGRLAMADGQQHGVTGEQIAGMVEFDRDNMGLRDEEETKRNGLGHRFCR